MQDLSRDEASYRVGERDHLEDDTPCICGSCGNHWRYDQLRPIQDCSLTPGDASPAGRCADPSCDSLAYPRRAVDCAIVGLCARFPNGHLQPIANGFFTRSGKAMTLLGALLDEIEEDQTSGEADGTYEPAPERWAQIARGRELLKGATAEIAVADTLIGAKA